MYAGWADISPTYRLIAHHHSGKILQRENQVARMPRSSIREQRAPKFPDSAWLHPGYGVSSALLFYA